jgi:hypothetical protein
LPRTCRILDQNTWKTSGAVLTADSYITSCPPRFLLDQLRSKPWRSDTGWVVTTGYNDKLDFNRAAGPGNFTITLAGATYATAAILCEAIRSGLEAADPTPVWAVTYSDSTKKFTISADLPFKLAFGTVDAAAQRLWNDMGWDTSGGLTAAATTFTADDASYHGRHWVAVDLGSAMDHQAAFLVDTNTTSDAVIRFCLSNTSVLHALTTPNYSEFLTGTGDLSISYFASVQTYRYAVFVIFDPGNTDGFNEVGIAYSGLYRQPSVGFSVNYQEEGDDLSEIERATEGALYGDLKVEAPAYDLEFLEVPTADADIFRAHRSATPKGKCFGFGFDAGVDTLDFEYGFRDGGLPIVAAAGGQYWTAKFKLVRALP